ncbi:MAG: sugar phosphate nucleotidyltransferase [Patescibacteria group bacterium]|jgi:NDP-sugar pyrophosphorylase family protein|nr:sugar phosphate nucleotidyltransferase [Patescibacteria group bacterium]HPL01643.1 sugar phosphate nucleotidyltransferase [bacterium]
MKRERITISIREDLLQKIDQRIDGVKMRNRSHAIELLVSESLGLSQISFAIIMAGGKGAMKLLPSIEEAIRGLKRFGFDEVVIAVGFLGDKIKNVLGDGKKFGIKINYIEGGEGTAGALLPIKEKIKKTFVVINIDETMNINVKNLVDFHRQHLSVITVATKDMAKLKGYYILEPEVFNYIGQGFSMLEEDVFPKLASENKLVFYPLI